MIGVERGNDWQLCLQLRLSPCQAAKDSCPHYEVAYEPTYNYKMEAVLDLPMWACMRVKLVNAADHMLYM